MQRSITYKNSVVTFLYVIAFLVYTALSGIYLFLPPFLAILFLLYSQALKQESITNVLFIILCLIIFEAQNDYILFSILIYFSLIHKYVMPKIVINSSCNACIKMFTVFLVYVGFYIFYILLSNVFLLPMPSLNYYVIYYILIEFLIMSML